MKKKDLYTIIVGVLGAAPPLSFGVEIDSIYYWIIMFFTLVVLINLYNNLED